MPEYRLLRHEEMDAAARLHRRASATIPGHPVLHTPEEDRAFYRDTVFAAGPIWGAFEEDRLVGHMALSPGWIEHLCVDPDRHGQGLGRALVTIGQREQDDLQLWTFQANARARRFYERLGFVPEEFTDGAQNEVRQPDVRYRWRRAACPASSPSLGDSA